MGMANTRTRSGPTAGIDSPWQGADLPSSVATGSLGAQPWLLMNGDSRSMLQHLPNESVHCVVTSPPYYSQRDYGMEGQYGLEASPDLYVEHLRSVFAEVRSVMAKNGTLFLNLGDTYYSAKGRPHGQDAKHQRRRMADLRPVDGPGLGLPRKSLLGIPWRVALALQADGWTLRSNIIWARESSVPEPTAKDRPWRTFEHVFLFTKAVRYHFDRDGLGAEEDIWRIEPERNAESRGVHYAPFPRELVRRCLEIGCPEGGVVLDPFVGGGTTMYEALASNRSAIGIDLNKDFYELVENRLRQRESGQVIDLTASTPSLTHDDEADAGHG
jgi:DNA modification methylase